MKVSAYILPRELLDKFTEEQAHYVAPPEVPEVDPAPETLLDWVLNELESCDPEFADADIIIRNILDVARRVKA